MFLISCLPVSKLIEKTEAKNTNVKIKKEDVWDIMPSRYNILSSTRRYKKTSKAYLPVQKFYPNISKSTQFGRISSL